MKLIFLLLLFISSFPGNCQEGDEIFSEDDEAFLNELESGRKRHAETANRLNETHENIKEAIVDLPGELKALGYDTIDAAAMMDEKVIALLKKSLEENSLRKLPPGEASRLILEKAQGSWIYGFLSERPKLVNAFADVLTDEKALPSAIGLFQRKEDLKIYFFIWIGFMVLGWLFKKIFFKKDWDKVTILVLGMLVSFSFSACSVTTFYHMFYDELSPAANILWQHWRRRNL